MEIFIAMIIWFMLCTIFAELGAALIIGLGAAIRFLFVAQWMAIFAILRAMLWLLVQLVRLLIRALIMIGRFLAFAMRVLFYLIQDGLRGGQADDQAADEDDEEELYDAALRLLGLPPDYSRAALDVAFKRAIRKAHPDTGGSVDQAQAVNTARDLLLRRKGWA